MSSTEYKPVWKKVTDLPKWKMFGADARWSTRIDGGWELRVDVGRGGEFFIVSIYRHSEYGEPTLFRIGQANASTLAQAKECAIAVFTELMAA